MAHQSPGRSLPDLPGRALPDDDRPQTPREWETWLAATRKTITKVIIREDGTPDER